MRESIQALKDAQAQTQEEHPLTIRHVLTDHLGTPIALVNANGEQLGQVAWVARYTSWGEIADEYNPDQIHQPIRFQGQQLDEETNLHYNRFRYYDPRVGQYITQDPIGLEGGINKVLYVDASPANSVDAMGLAPGDRYSSQHAAAKAAINGVNPSSIKRNQEFGGMICRDEKGRYLYTRPKDGGEDAVNPGGPGSCPKLSKATAYYHTHGGQDPRYDSENFSTADMRYADRYAIDGYVGTPAGNLKHYNYSTGKDVVIGKVKTK